MRYVAISKNYLIDVKILDQPGQLSFGINVNAIRIELACQLGGVFSALNVGDLGGSEGHYLILIIITKKVLNCGNPDLRLP